MGGSLVEWEAERRFLPELRATVYVSTSVQNRVGEGQAAFRLLSGRLDACGGVPLGPLRLRACAATELGVLHGSADSSPALETTRAESRVWLAGGALAELAVPLRPVALSARGGVLAPLLRDQFVRVRASGEHAQLHEPSAVGAVVEVSAAFALW